MTNYEVLFIVDNSLEDEKKEAAVELVKGVIEDGGEVVNIDVWGRRRLAYPIEKKNDGHYVLVDFKGNPTLPKELDRRLKISDAIVRHIIVNKDEK